MIDEEALLISRAQEGDLDAFSELITKHKKLIYNLCLRMLYDRGEAEDATQEAFMKIYRGLKSYNGTSKFSTWAVKIASNICIDIIRKRKITTLPIEDYELKDDTSPEKSYIKSESYREIEQAIEALPEKYKIMIVYYHFMNLSYEEISKILKEPMTIVKNRLYRARLMLKENLKEKGGYNGLQSG
ncbi:ECF RNA polymerase sigma factor SigW [Oxobacter pfennigii]|uniref:ECF RNA polymerase sigma factor SigW n=1 Tax=Oxobacter pfennigii TaxID=36849 RepID=A0A0P9AEA1_9CLOT|nr:sigma-70 family RNA polymerase sigma factor [Oxobacter pfennigii]KPU43626.1 ECF RNA polymerase sigma factor SigW [Oxobacter pfennigii]